MEETADLHEYLLANTTHDEGIDGFCQEFEELPECQSFDISDSATLLQLNGSLEPLAHMVEHGIITIVSDVIDVAKHFPLKDAKETSVVVIHVEKTGKSITVTQDIYNTSCGIANRMACEGVVDNGEVSFL